MATEQDLIVYALKIDLGNTNQNVASLQAEIAKLQQKLDGAKPAAQAVGDSTKKLGENAGRAKESISVMASAIGVLNPQLGGLIAQANAATGALQSVGKSATLLGVSAGPLALLGVAVAALALVWKKLSDNVKEADERMKAASAAATKAQGLAGQASAQRAEEQFRAGKITAEQYKAELVASGTLTSPAIEATNAVAQARYQDLQAGEKARTTTLAGDTFDRESAALEPLRAALQTAKDNAAAAVLAAASAQVAKVAEEVAKDTKSSPAAKNAAKLASMAAQSAAEAFSSGVLASGPSADFVNARIGATSANRSLPGFGGYSLGGFTGVGTFGGYSLDQAGVNYTPSATSAVVTHGYDYDLEQKAKRQATAMNILGGSASLLQGDAVGALGAIGGPASMIAGSLANIGTSGARGVSDQLTNLKDVIIEALEALPEILSEVIPEFIQAIVSEVIPALVQNLPDILLGLVKGIVEGIGALLNPFDGEKKSTSEAKSDYAEYRSTHAGGGRAGGRSYAIGTESVLSDGLAMLHKREIVSTPGESDLIASGARSNPAGGGRGGVTHVYEINGPVGDDAFAQIIERQISQRFGPGGMGYSTGLSGGLRSS